MSGFDDFDFLIGAVTNERLRGRLVGSRRRFPPSPAWKR
ncbi:hypothetical protein J2X50_004378 [Aminobacter sp. BE322]